MTVGSLISLFHDHYMMTNLAPNTYRGYMTNINNHILPYHADLDPDQLTYADIDNLVAELHRKGLKNKTINYVLATYRKALNFGIRRGYISRNVILSYDKPRNEVYYPEIYDADQITQLLTIESDSAMYPAVFLACTCGVRRGEAAGLKNEDVKSDRICIRRTVSYDHGLKITPCKNRRQRVILIDPDISERLQRYNRERPRNVDGWFIRKADGSSVNPNSITKHFHKLRKKLGLPHIRFHDIRHSYATLMMENDVHPKTVQQILGHSSVKVTLDLYSHANVNQQQAALNVIKKIKK